MNNEETPNGQTPPPGSPPPPPRSPFQAPSSMGPGGGMNPNAAKDALNVPSLIMIVLSIIGLILLAISFAGGGSGNQEMIDMVNEFMRQSAEQQGQDFEPIDVESFAQGAIVGNYLMLGLQLVITIFILWSCFKMRNLESWNLVLVANILAVLPCFMPCCCIQIPFAIWNLVLLNKPEIKAAFS